MIKEFFLIIAFFCQTLYGCAVMSDSTIMKQDKSVDSAPTKSSINIVEKILPSEKDSCYYLIIGESFEKVGDLEKAYEAYKEALKCVNIENRNQAVSNIKRISSVFAQRQKGFFSFIWNIIDITLRIVFLVIFLLLFISLLRLLCRSFTKIKEFLKIKEYKTVRIEALEVSPSSNEIFAHFKANFDYVNFRRERLLHLRRNISQLESETVKPSIRSQYLSEIIEITAMIVEPKSVPVISKIYNYINPADCLITGSFYNISDVKKNVVIKLKKIGKQIKIWEATYDVVNVQDDLKSLALDIITYIENESN